MVFRVLLLQTFFFHIQDGEALGRWENILNQFSPSLENIKNMEKSSSRRNSKKSIERVQSCTLSLQEEMAVIRKVNFDYWKKFKKSPTILDLKSTKHRLKDRVHKPNKYTPKLISFSAAGKTRRVKHNSNSYWLGRVRLKCKQEAID